MSWQARLTTFIVRRHVRRHLGDLSDIPRVRAVFNAPLSPPPGARYTPARLGGVAGEWVESERSTVGGLTLLYLHGGGFVGGSPRTHRPITAALALAGARVFVPDYRLAPEHPFPAAPDDARAAWQALCDSPPDAPLAVAGDSAGGNLALGLMLRLRDEGARMPLAAVLFSPATDLTASSPSVRDNARRDAVLQGDVRALVGAYRGAADPADPRLSPLLGDLGGLPPLLVHVGADEVLRDDALRLADKARASGVQVALKVWPVVHHGWQLVWRLPEARESLALACQFLKDAAAAVPRTHSLPAEPSASAAPHAEAQTLAPFPDPSARHAGHAYVIIIGAGLSGVGTAVHLKQRCPDKRVLLLEAREAMGGTWDLFRYPGIRSDSDMHTLGYAFKPWTRPQAIADGGSIRSYIEETAREHGIDSQVRYGHRVRRAAWSTAEARWTLEVSHGDELLLFTCQVVDFCSGYYRYDAAHRPSWPGEAAYRGRIVHPQFWPEGLDYTGQRVVVIGSGATAVTLVPEMAREAAHVTMLQRSPTYVVALPAQDAVARWLRRWLPALWAYRLVRTKNVLLSLLFFKLARRWPEPVRRRLLAEVGRHLGSPQEVARNFTPHYNPWDQRLCMVPDGDLFTAIRAGRASVVTGEIDAFTETGLRLATGETVQADLVVTATGLQLNVLGDVELRVDGRVVDVHRCFVYKGMMLSGVPNLVQTFGYTNASWTLKSDLTGRYLCRLLRHMDRQGTAIATPTAGPGIEPRPFVDFSSGYVLRAADKLPRQGAQAPWRLHQNYLRDLLALRFGRLDDGVMVFTSSLPATVAAGPAGAAD